MQPMLKAARFRSRAYSRFSAQDFGLTSPRGPKRPAYVRNSSDDGSGDGAFWIFLVLMAGVFSAITALLWWS